MAVVEKTLETIQPRRLRLRFDTKQILGIAVLLILCLLVVYPAVALLLDSFQVARPGGLEETGLANWTEAWSHPDIVRSIRTTITLTLATEAIALPVGIVITWLMTRTEVPGRGLLDVFFWVAFFLPALPVIMGWILLLDPNYGLLNDFASETLGIGTFNIYSFWGIVWIHLVAKSIAAKYILLAPAFRNMDSSLEESSRVCGVSGPRTLLRVVLPLMLPAIIVTAVLSLIYSVESFETELILGRPADMYVYSSKIYQLTHQNPPLFGEAKVLGVSVLLMMIPLIVMQQIYGGRRQVTTVTSRFRAERMRMGRLRWLISGSLFTGAAIATILPMCLLVLGTFMTIFGFFDIKDPWTVSHWTNLLDDPALRDSLVNSIKIGLGAAIIGTLWYSIVAYVSVRTRFKARAVVDFLSWLPVAIPGLILSLGILSLVLDIPLMRDLYGSLTVLILALVIAGMTTGVQLIKSNLQQIHAEMEEASVMCGAGWFYTYRRVTLPLLAPALVTVAIITFAIAVSNVAHVAMLSSGSNEPLSTLQLQYMTVGEYEAAAAVGVLIVALSTGFALVARLVSRRISVQETT